MNMVFQRLQLLPEKSIEELLTAACPSIQYRILDEIFNEPHSLEKMRDLQAEILKDAEVKRIVNSQAPDGWLGSRFHGYDSLEAGIRLLCEKGLRLENPILSQAIRSIELNNDRIAKEMGTVGKGLDKGGYGGTSLMQATILAYAGLENKPLVQEQIQAALQGFRAVLKVDSLDQITENYRGKTVYRQGATWPGIYHLRLLAFTHSWRNEPNREMVQRAVKRLVVLSPIPYILVRYKSQIIAPAAFAMQEFNPDMSSMDAGQWMMWFHRMELLARLGVVGSIPELQNQLQILLSMLEQGEGWFALPLRHTWFRRWGAYTGLMLERDWRTSQRRVFDLTFRSLLIKHYSMM